MNTVGFFFDCSSPWTYLAFEQIQRTLYRIRRIRRADPRRRRDVALARPILVGGVFNTVNRSVYEARANPVPAKARYYAKDLQDWARYVGIKIGSPAVFPVDSVKAMRSAFVAEEAGCIR